MSSNAPAPITGGAPASVQREESEEEEVQGYFVQRAEEEEEEPTAQGTFVQREAAEEEEGEA
jgi:hypothetical protein